MKTTNSTNTRFMLTCNKDSLKQDFINQLNSFPVGHKQLLVSLFDYCQMLDEDYRLEVDSSLSSKDNERTSEYLYLIRFTSNPAKRSHGATLLLACTDTMILSIVGYDCDGTRHCSEWSSESHAFIMKHGTGVTGDMHAFWRAYAPWPLIA